MSEFYELPNGWEWVELLKLTKVFSDGDWIESKDQSDSGIRLIQTGNVGIGLFKDRGDKARYISESTFDRLRCTEIFEDDCLISRLPEPLGRSCLIPKLESKLITSVDCTIVRFGPNLLPKFFVYYSQSDHYFQLIKMGATGATRLRISKKNLSNIPIPLPQLTEQQRIVEKLDLLFEKIEKAIALHQKNIDEADAFMGSALNEVFGELDLSTTVKLKSITSKIGSGATPNGGQKAYKTIGTSLIRSMNVHDDGFRKDGLAFIDQQQSEKLNNVVVEPNDVLLNITGASVARCCIVDQSVLPARVNQHVSIIRLNKGFLPNFLHYFLISPSKKADLLFSSSGGATREAITKSMIENFEIPNTPLPTQQKVVTYLDDLSEKIERVKTVQKEKMDSLKALKASILDKAFRGEL